MLRRFRFDRDPVVNLLCLIHWFVRLFVFPGVLGRLVLWDTIVGVFRCSWDVIGNYLKN